MIAATILPLVGAHGDPARAVALASMLALLVGAMTTLAGVARLGFVADLLSKPTMIGYMNGLAVTILVGQLPKLFGFSVEGDSFIAELRGFVKGVANGDTVRCRPDHRADRVGRDPRRCNAGCRGSRACWWRWSCPSSPPTSSTWPTTASRWWAPCRGGSRRSPYRSVRLSDLGLLIGGALGIAVVSLADTISTASSFAARSGDEIDGNREMIGIGAANIAAGFFQGFPVSHQRLADGGGRAGRRQDPGHRAGRGASPSP